MTSQGNRPPVEAANYWQQRYEKGDTGWDSGAPEGPLLQAFHDGHLPVGKMVVPGCGTGWEVTAFAALGFDVTGIDFAAAPLQALQARASAEGLAPTLLQADIFALPDTLNGQFDSVLELACYCAIAPEQRDAYVTVVDRLLKPDGMLVGMFYTNPNKVGGPPFKATVEEIQMRFAPVFATVDLRPSADGEWHLGLCHRKGLRQ
ncbi:MAG: methyltransferase domain-containing protein [Candidatus Sericytochromatia bacterium]|nr:methyltransferase domain-containing protein [Candidatus Sericytochromatia bacterium]